MRHKMEQAAKDLKEQLSKKGLTDKMLSVRCACQEQCQIVINLRWFDISDADLKAIKPTKIDGGNVYYKATPPEIITFVDAFLAKSKTLSPAEVKRAAA